MISLAEIAQFAQEEGLEHAEAIAELARPGYRLVPTRQPAEVGASKLGGRPDLPPDVAWPLYDWGGQQLPMLFVGQVALGELVGADWFATAGGLLSVFFGAHPDRGMTDNFRAACVLYTPAHIEVRPASVDNPAGEQPTLNELAVEPRALRTLPDDDLPLIQALGLDWDQAGDDPATRNWMYERFMAYMRLRDRVVDAQHPSPSGERPLHQFLGWPRSHQASALIDFAGSEAEVEDWYSRMDDDELDNAIIQGAMQWQLLLQIDHDERLETDFGDGGGLYVGVPADDIAQGDFSRVEGVTQSG